MNLEVPRLYEISILAYRTFEGLYAAVKVHVSGEVMWFFEALPTLIADVRSFVVMDSHVSSDTARIHETYNNQ